MTLLSKCCGKEAYKAIGGLFLNRKIWVCSECGKYCKVYKPYQVEEEKTMEIKEILEKLLKDYKVTDNKHSWDGFYLDQAETALQALIDKKVKEAVEEKNTILDAWHTVFGTTQLTHAEDRLKVAEEKVKKQEQDIKNMRIVIETQMDLKREQEQQLGRLRGAL